MKKCKSCLKEIDLEAKKCPYCQAYQKWYLNPLLYISPLIFLPTILRENFREKEYKYEDYKDSFSSEFVNKVDESKNYAIHTYRIINNSDMKWKDISFQLIGYDENGKVIVVESKTEYYWIIGPNQSRMFSVELRKNSLVKKWELKIVGMSSE